MAEFNTVLKALRSEKKMSQQELANALNISKSSINMYERGDRQPNFEMLELIADYFNVDTDYLLGRTTKTTRVLGVPFTGAVRIPVLGRVVAGIPIDAVQDILDWEEITDEIARTGEFFALQIKEDSMEPRMKEGDVVIVRQQPDAESGDIVIAAVNGDEATCKRLMKYESGIALLSNNPNYLPMQFNNVEILEKPITILGKVVELRGKF